MDVADKFCEDSLYSRVYNSSIDIHWTDGGSRHFWYSLRDTAGGRTFCLADTRTGRRRQLSEEEVKKYRETAESAPRRKVSNTDWTKRWSEDSLFYMTAVDDELMLVRPGRGESFASGAVDSIILSRGGEHFCSFSSGGNANRFTLSASTGRRSAPIGDWIGGSHSYLAVREDKRSVRTLTLVDNLSSPRPDTETYKFPMPGDKDVSRFEVFLADADSFKLYRLPAERFKDQLFILPRFRNFQTGCGAAYLLRLARTRDTLDLVKIDAETREVSTVISEVCKPHLNEQLFSFHVLNDGKDILWWSERTGKGCWYLYDSDGNVKSVLGNGDFVGGRMEKIDTAARTAVFEAYGVGEGNPHYRHFVKASFDGKTCILLTPGEGEHEISFSPDGKLIYDTWSRMNLPPQHEIRDMKGRLVMTLESADISRLKTYGWKAPEVLRLMAADSITPLYGVVYLPFDIEPGRKYPVVSNVYPGPHTDLVPQGFILDDNCNQSLAQLGFIVVNFSYRGSCPVRGRDFYGYGYGNLRDYALDDDYAVIRQVAEHYPFADTSRVGIYGHSGGGFMALAAMLQRPDFYKVCVSASGNHDNNIYTQWWGETFHGGHWARGKDGGWEFECSIPTNMELAGNLRGRLLLITGDMDDNVHPASTFRMAKALIDKGKRFDMLVVPGADHGLGDKYYVNVIRYYFVEHLLGLPQKDTDIINHR